MIALRSLLFLGGACILAWALLGLAVALAAASPSLAATLVGVAFIGFCAAVGLPALHTATAPSKRRLAHLHREGCACEACSWWRRP